MQHQLGAQNHSPNSSLPPIQKTKNKRTVLPKTSLIQLYLDTNYQQKAGCSKAGAGRLLPGFNQQNILNQLSSVPYSTASTSHLLTKKPSPTTHHRRIQQASNQFQIADRPPKRIGYNAKENLIRHLAREFFLDCKQRMDSASYRQMLGLLTTTNNNNSSISGQKRLLNVVFGLIGSDRALCNKFAAFLCVENALRFDLFDQTVQYEKCYEFLNKLELLVANKCAFKKLIQLIINTATRITEQGKMSTKIDEIRAKLKSVTKNNQFLIYEFDYLFDQRYGNLEPVYEILSLVDSEPQPLNDENLVEFVDLTAVVDSGCDNLGVKCKTAAAKFLRCTSSNNSATNSTKCSKNTTKK